MRQPNDVKNEVGPMLKEIASLSHKLTDTNVKNENVHAVLLVGLTEKDFEALQKVAEANPRFKNYGVLTRHIIRQVAKGI